MAQGEGDERGNPQPRGDVGQTSSACHEDGLRLQRDNQRFPGRVLRVYLRRWVGRESCQAASGAIPGHPTKGWRLARMSGKTWRANSFAGLSPVCWRHWTAAPYIAQLVTIAAWSAVGRCLEPPDRGSVTQARSTSYSSALTCFSITGSIWPCGGG